MTTELTRRLKDRPSLLRRGRGFFWVLTTILSVAAFFAWVTLGVGLHLGVQSSTRLVLAIVAAVATETLFWSVAAALGVSMLEARKKLWRWISQRGES